MIVILEVDEVDDAVGSTAGSMFVAVVVVAVDVVVVLDRYAATVALPRGILEARRVERFEYLHLAKLCLVVLIAQFANKR